MTDVKYYCAIYGVFAVCFRCKNEPFSEQNMNDIIKKNTRLLAKTIGCISVRRENKKRLAKARRFCFLRLIEIQPIFLASNLVFLIYLGLGLWEFTKISIKTYAYLISAVWYLSSAGAENRSNRRLKFGQHERPFWIWPWDVCFWKICLFGHYFH